MVTAIVKPTHDCNLACRYCYLEPNAEQGRMSYKTLASLMEQVAKYSKDKSSHFIWHGGEPLLMGLDFYEEAAQISHFLRRRGYHVSNGIQSNGTLVNDHLLSFIEREDDFQLGLSLDGPRHINNRTRVYRDGRGAFDEIFSGVKKVRDYSIEHSKRQRYIGGGVIVVLSSANANDLVEIYQFFKKEQVNIKINPVILCGKATNELSLTPQQYAKALNKLFDVWIKEEETMDVDPFTTIMGNLMTQCPVSCNFSPSCRKDFVSIGPQGDIYPCGRFDGIREFWLGNVNENGGLAKAIESEIQRNLACRSAKTVIGCDSCNFQNVCNAGCMHNAHTAGDVMGKDPYCAAYKGIFSHIEAFLHKELRRVELQ